MPSPFLAKDSLEKFPGVGKQLVGVRYKMSDVHLLALVLLNSLLDSDRASMFS